MIKDGLKIEDEVIRSYLMIGQSNMAGRGEFGDVEPINNKMCYMLRMGRWQRMREPINPDRPIFEGIYHSGTSLGASFADETARRMNVKVGMIPCADGGTSIEQWMPGEVLYDHAVMMTRLAMRSSVFSGILWHQGESACGSDENVRAYKEKFMTMMTSLRRDLGAENIPVIIGELSERISEKFTDMGERPRLMNGIFHEIAEELPLCGVVSSDGLTLKPDGIHFDAASLREFGRRYFEAYTKLI